MWLLQRDVLVNYHTEVSPVAIISVKYSRYVWGVRWLHKLFARALPCPALISCATHLAILAYPLHPLTKIDTIISIY